MIRARRLPGTLAGVLIPLAVFLHAASAQEIPTPAVTDDIIPEHGKYTAAYQSDWSKLPTEMCWPGKTWQASSSRTCRASR